MVICGKQIIKILSKVLHYYILCLAWKISWNSKKIIIKEQDLYILKKSIYIKRKMFKQEKDLKWSCLIFLKTTKIKYYTYSHLVERNKISIPS